MLCLSTLLSSCLLKNRKTKKEETSRWWFPCHLKLDVEWPGNRKPLIASVVWRVCFQHKWDASCGQTPDQRSSLIVIKIIKVSWWYSPAILFQCFDCRASHTSDAVKIGSLWWRYSSCCDHCMQHEKHRLMRINKSRNQKTHAKTGTRPMNEGGSTQEDRNLRSNGNTGE